MNYKLNDPRRNVKIFWNGNIYSKNLSFPCTRRTLLEKKEKKKENKQHKQLYSMEFNCTGREGCNILLYS